MNQPTFIEAHSILYAGRLPKIKKASSPLQPIYEAFTNALEAIKILKDYHGIDQRSIIVISLFTKKDLLSKQKNEYNLDRIEITDSGVGFDHDEYSRLITLDDNRKGYSNKGSGRVQFLHVFNETKVASVFRDKSSSTGFRQRMLTLSKSAPFLKNNAIIRLDEGNMNEVNASTSSSHLRFENILEPKDQSTLNALTIEGLKENIISRYLASFCKGRDDLPEIVLNHFVDEELNKTINISNEDIPSPDKEQELIIHYNSISGKVVSKLESTESFQLKAFKISSNKLAKNELKLTSKGEVVDHADIKLESLLPTDDIDGYRYLFLLSGDYIDGRDSDTRGKINIIRTADALKKQGELLATDEVILLDHIEEKANSSILNLYDEIKAKVQEKWSNIEKLQKMFLLNPVTLQSLKNKIGANDTDDTILKKVYEADAKILALKDAEIKRQIDALARLDTSKKDYNDNLTSQVDELVKVIPQQNRTALTHYVARRKLVLDLFGKIIDKQLDVQKDGTKGIDEKLLHNLIFQQASDNTEESDLWLINEDYIYFKGTSEGQLSKIELDDNAILKNNLSQEEDNYRLKQEGNANRKRPDILLFPNEGKCIIIELKSLDTNISEHLNQINRYASLINNLSKDEYNFTTFYGYLIGENIDVDDVIDNDSDFISAHHLKFLYRPYKRIAGKFGKGDGSLYTEVIKYSTLLERASMRNKSFIDKITK